MDDKLYSIPPLSDDLVVTDNRGETTFTVVNATDKPLATEFRIDAEEPAGQDWFQIDKPQRVIPARGVEQVKVTLTAPPGATGQGSFTIVAIWRDRPDEFFTKGPAVGFTLAAPATPPTPEPNRVPWWVFLIVGLVVVLVSTGVGWYFLRDGDEPEEATVVAVPSVEGLDVERAMETLEDAGLHGRERAVTAGPGTVGAVVRQNPRAAVRVKEGTEVRLTVRRE